MPTPSRRSRVPVELQGLKAVGHDPLFWNLTVVQVRKDLQNALFSRLLSLATGTRGPTPSALLLRPLRLFALAADVATCCKWHFFNYGGDQF